VGSVLGSVLWNLLGAGAIGLPLLGLGLALAGFDRLPRLDMKRAAFLIGGLSILVPYIIGVATRVMKPELLPGFAERTLAARAVGVLPGFFAILVRERIGVGGHSFGAHTSMLVGGAVVYPGRRSFRDPRAKCTLLISPQGVGGLFREDSWKDYPVPALVITGSNDTSPINDTKPEDRLAPFKLGPDGRMHLVWIEGAHHGFGGISGARFPGAGPKDEGQVWVVEQASLAFFDAFVKGDDAAAKWLRDGELAKTDRAKVRCETRKPNGK
jgi:predicted dienelactone hydrolase